MRPSLCQVLDHSTSTSDGTGCSQNGHLMPGRPRPTSMRGRTAKLGSGHWPVGLIFTGFSAALRFSSSPLLAEAVLHSTGQQDLKPKKNPTHASTQGEFSWLQKRMRAKANERKANSKSSFANSKLFGHSTIPLTTSRLHLFDNDFESHDTVRCPNAGLQGVSELTHLHRAKSKPCSMGCKVASGCFLPPSIQG